MVDEILTAEELSRYLKIPKYTIYKLAKTGIIPATKVGKHWRFKRQKIDRWFSSQQVSNIKRAKKR